MFVVLGCVIYDIYLDNSLFFPDNVLYLLTCTYDSDLSAILLTTLVSFTATLNVYIKTHILNIYVIISIVLYFSVLFLLLFW